MKPSVHSGKVLLIGWDAADWKIIHRLVDGGKMPNMAGFIEEGVMGNLATLSPKLSPMLWTSIATGKRPFKHGILGFTEPDPHSGGIRPVSNISRKTRTIWNILSQTGRKCVVVGWWPSHPVEPINGVMVSNHYQRAVSPYGKPWPMKAGGIQPLTDGRRNADEDNLRGYYEHEKVKNLARDSSWLPEAKGKAVKVIVQLLSHLPSRQDLRYRVVFMVRDLDEVIRSQKAMLTRLGRRGAKLTDEQLKAAYKNQVNQVKRILALKRIPTLFVEYEKCLNDKDTAIHDINSFLGGGLDTDAISGAIDPTLRRQKAEKTAIDH